MTANIPGYERTDPEQVLRDEMPGHRKDIAAKLRVEASVFQDDDTCGRGSYGRGSETRLLYTSVKALSIP
jgi:hypothetical protein